MTPQERQLIDDLFDRLSKVEGSPRDPDAMSAIMQGLRTAPNAIYALVQTVLVQDEALKQAHHRIEELEAADTAQPQPNQGGSFLDSMRDAVFGSNQSHGSVPNVPPPGAGSRPVWNSGQVLQQSPSRYDQSHYDQGYGQNQGYGQGSYNQGSYNQGYGAPQGGMMGGPMGGAFGGGGGSFLGTAAAAAAGVVGGSLLLNSFRGMMGGLGGGRSAFGDTSTIGENRGLSSDQSRSDLARDAGINDIGSRDSQQDLARQDREQDAQQDRDDDSGRAGFFDSASSDDDHDSDGFDGDGGDSDYA
jgi:hypothetical protein